MSNNGRLTSAQLSVVQGKISLAKDAATDYLNMRAAAEKAKIGIAIATPLGGYRNLAQQLALKVSPKSFNSPLPSSAIASPGSSTHGEGEKVDIVGVNALGWVIANGKKFGFTQRDAKNDPNCFQHAAGVHSKTVDPTARVLNHSAYAYKSPKRTGVLRPAHKKGELIHVNGFITGAKVGNTTLWFRTTSGHYITAYRFNDKSTTGLKNLNL